jgi:hypothetical protein
LRNVAQRCATLRNTVALIHCVLLHSPQQRCAILRNAEELPLTQCAPLRPSTSVAQHCATQ